MARRYVKKTTQRPREERQLSVRADHHDPPDLEKLTELLVRLTLQESGQTQAIRHLRKEPRTLRR